MKKSDKTKQRILHASTRLFALQGYSNTSTKDIANMAEVSEATLFKYFKSKDGLFKAILMSLIDELKKISIADIGSLVMATYTDRTLYHILSTIVHNRIKFLDQHDSTIKAIIQEVLINNELKEQVQLQVWPEISKTLSNLFNKAILDGEIKPHETKYLVSHFISSISAPVIASYVVPTYDKETRKTYINHHFEMFYATITALQKEISHD